MENKNTIIGKFVAHNRNIFKKRRQSSKRQPLILFELNNLHSAHIAYSYLANILSADNDAKIGAYQVKAHRSLWEKILFKIKGMVGHREFGIYKSFGVTRFFNISISSLQKKKAKKIFYEVVGGLTTKNDIENLKINGVLIGNLIYDSFLMENKKPTIDIALPEFSEFLLNSLNLFVFWEDFISKHDVCAVNVSHCVYNLAIPLRISLARNIPVFQANATHIYRMNSGNQYAFTDYKHFPKLFAALPESVQLAGINEAKKRINRRFEGEVGVDMSYSTKSAYGPNRHEKLVQDSSRKKILIATHCFFDSPHCYGGSIFPDHYEWIDFLGNISEETDYDWYIKTHPDLRIGNMEIIDSFLGKYPKFKLLPANVSHHQIISEGINLALTVHGTIGFEYAALGVPVINASQNNPHIAYDFNLHVKDIVEYRQILLDLDQLELSIDKQQVYEYYFMRFIFNTSNLFFNDHDKMLDEIGGYGSQFTSTVYEKWLDEWEEEKHINIVSAIKRFSKSNDFRMDYTHFNREPSLDFEQNLL